MSTKNWLYDLFDCAYVITMDSRIEKVDSFFTSISNEPTIFRAMNKYDTTRESLISEGFIEEDCKLNLGRICCHYSHCKVLERFLNSKYSTAIIFEDDNFPLSRSDAENIKTTMMYIMKTVPSDWELVNFSRCWDFCSMNREVNKDTVQTYRALCRNCYAVTRAGAKKILDNTVPMKKMNGDVSVMKLTRKNNVLLKAYASTNNLFSQNRETLSSELDNTSKIQTCTKMRVRRRPMT